MAAPASLRSLSRLIWIFAALAILLWLLPLVAPHSDLFPTGPAFADVTVYRGRFTLLHTARFFNSRAFSAFAYPAGAAPLYALLYKTADPVRTFLILAGILVAAALAALSAHLRSLRAASLFIPLTIALSYPIVFLIQRGNVELVLVTFSALAILLFRRGLAVLAAILVGLAAAAKLYPIFLLGLFLRRRRDLPAFLTGVATFILATAAAIIWAGPTISMATAGFFTGVGRFQDHYVNTVSRTEILWDHCLFAPIKNWAYAHHTTTTPYIHTYYVVAGLLALVLFLRVRTLPLLNRAVFLTAAMVSLPPVSFNYTLAHLYIPAVLLLSALITNLRANRATALATFTLLLVLFLPLATAFPILPVAPGLLQSLALALVLLLSAALPWTSNTAADTL